MSRRVAICAVAQTRFESNMWHKRVQEIVFDVFEPIIQQTGVTFDEEKGIRNIITCSDDVFDARTISNNAVTDAVGAHYRGEEKIAMDGINAIGYGLASILSGHDEIVLIIGHCKESQSESRNMCANLAFDPFYYRPLGLDFLNVAALQARAYMNKSDITDKHLARVVVNARKNAAKNPLANLREQVTLEQVMNSPMLCDPIRQIHAYPVSDGAVGMLLVNEERYKEFTDKPVWITGFANSMDSYFLGDKDLTENFSLKQAAKRAYKMAGIKKPDSEFDVVEIDAAYAYQVPMWSEMLGLCKNGCAGRWIDEDGLEKKNVNVSGGTLAGNPIMISGLSRAAEAVLQLRQEAGEHQVPGARKALAHGTTGSAGQHQSVLILEKDK